MCEQQPYSLEIDGGGKLLTRSVVIATGAQYRKLPLENLAQFEGNGIYYGATFVEAQLCQGEEVIVVGGGNSAGQAAIFLSQIASHVHILIRACAARRYDVQLPGPPHRAKPRDHAS